MLSKYSFLFLAAIIFVHIFILTKLIYFPYPELFVYPYLTNNGLKPYAQILDQHFPGLMFLPINFDNLGMKTAEVARIWSISIVILIHVMLFLIGSKVLKDKRLALFVNLLYLIWQPFFEGWVLWIDSFLPLLLLPAFYFLNKNKFFLTGLFLGIAIVFKQVIIPLSILVGLYMLWRKKSTKDIVNYAAGLSIPVVFMLIYLLSIGVAKDFWYWTVLFNLTTYAQYGRGEGVDFAHLSRAALVFGIAFLMFFKIKDKIAQILLIFLIGNLIGLSTRFDFVHFQPALPFALISSVCGFNIIWRKSFSKFIVTFYILISIWWLFTFYKGHIGDKVFFFDNQTKQIADKIRQYSKPSEKIFVFGAPPHLYQMANRLPAGNIFVFQFPWFLKVAEGRILEGIIQDKPGIIVSDRSSEIEGKRLIDYAKDIDQYIQENYEMIDQLGATAILRRKLE